MTLLALWVDMINGKLIIYPFATVLTKISFISSELFSTMRAFVIKKMWYKTEKHNYGANIKQGLIHICQQHNDKPCNH